MAAAKITSVTFSVLLVSQLLLLATTATTAISIPAGAVATRPTTGPAAEGVPAALPFPTEGDAEAAAADCWKAVQQAESCAVDVLRWLASPDLASVRVSVACCAVLVRVGDRCLNDLFPGSVLGALYAPLVRHACGNPLSVTPGGPQL